MIAAIKMLLGRCQVSGCWSKATVIKTWRSTGPIRLCQYCADNLELLCYEPEVPE